MWRLGPRPGQAEENKSLKRRSIHGEVEERHKRNVSDPSGAGVEGDPYHVPASFLTGPLTQTVVLPTQGKHDCPLMARGTMRLERPSSLSGLHWVFHFFAVSFPWAHSRAVAGAPRCHLGFLPQEWQTLAKLIVPPLSPLPPPP